MVPGDIFTLIKKSNSDWWYVRKDGDQKGVYLPATYAWKKKKKDSSIAKVPGHILPHAHMNHDREAVPQYRQDGFSALARQLDERMRNNVVVSEPNVPDFPDPDYENVQSNRPSRLNIRNNDRPYSPTSNTPGTSSTSSLLSPSFPSSQPSTGPATRDDTPPGLWEAHKDDKGRQYFYNPSTNETTWTKPRPLTPNSPQPTSITLTSNKLPAGWKEETTTNGETVYTHDNSTEKWYSSKNSKGEVYYYSANREHTTWELPAVIPNALRRQHSEDENQQQSSQLRAGIRNSRGEGQVRPNTIYGTGTFGGPVLLSGQRPAFPTDSNLVLNVRRRYSDLDGNELSPEAMAREKEGILNRAKLDDGRKSTKVKFVNSYAVLTGSTLTFYKDQKIAERAGSPIGTPEYSTALWGAEVEMPNKKHGKKSGTLQFELRELSGQTLLLQAENDRQTYDWYEAITGAIEALGPGQSRYHAQFSPEEGEFMFSHSGPGSGSSAVLAPVKLESNDKEKNKIKNKLKSFITRRPTIESLQKQGIMREENVFGKQLAHLCEKERTMVPTFVTKCISAIDKRGLQVDGIYRVSGNLSLIQKLRFQIDQEIPVDFDSSPYKEDIHVLTGALKLYFRELPEPVLTFGAYDPLIAAIRLPDNNVKLNIFKEVMRTLPRVNLESLKVLLEHLSRIVANSQHNRMTAQSVAIVFGPTLMWSQKESFNIAMNMVQQNQCIEFLLTEYKNIF
ncbi:rho GTPase-activating protein 15-like isoform X2 [Amphiura filiformis]|uniref:rho GTPase-activating protein 15-like isoform X2 n=1 Tax=Amphiura filiformis TaxID=82378 RepID=UPI003B223285